MIELASPAADGDTRSKPAAATHVLMFWPPTWRTPLEGLLKRITRAGSWTIYTVREWETGDYCKGDRWTLRGSQGTGPRTLTPWTSNELGQRVTLQYAGETKYGPVYWVVPS